jgi:SAM-dependent methyltransferase
MDFLDITWNLFRKLLSNKLYERLTKSKIGCYNDYHSIHTYKEIFNHYTAAGLEFNDKSVLEVGTGEQFFTAFYFLSAGAKEVALVDPLFSETSNSLLDQQAAVFSESTKHLPSTHKERLKTFRSFNDVPGNHNGTFDIICSHFVLEHFEDLNNFFTNASRLLRPNGICYNYIDLSDHAYHYFNRRPFTSWIYSARRLYHLRYSDAFYNRITDRRIWVNRSLLPGYKSLAAKTDLKITAINPVRYHAVKIHEDVLRRNPTPDPEDLHISHLALTLSK